MYLLPPGYHLTVLASLRRPPPDALRKDSRAGPRHFQRNGTETGYFFDPLTLHRCLRSASGDREARRAMIAMREVREIYHQGVWAVAGAFRQLYQMIEVKDEQIQKLIAVATAAHLKKI